MYCYISDQSVIDKTLSSTNNTVNVLNNNDSTMQPHTTPSIPWLRNCYLLFRAWPTASQSRDTIFYEKLYITLSRRCCKQNSLTHSGRDKMAVIFQTTFSNALFLNENEWISIKISLKFVPKGQINNIPSWFQIMAWRRPGDKPLSEAMMVSLLAHICVTRSQWILTAWPLYVRIGESKVHKMENVFFFYIMLIYISYPF